MLNVLLTVDVEVWPTHWNLDKDAFRTDFQRYIYGKTSNGEYGLPCQLQLLDEYRQKAVFFVETLFSREFGRAFLEEIVTLLRGAGQEVQLHVHPEWNGRLSQPLLPGRLARRMRDYSVDEQSVIIRDGLEALDSVGVGNVLAFRAGGYAANLATLSALKRNGVEFDTSYNPCILNDAWGRSPGDPLVLPRELNGVCEFPIGMFEDWPGHFRHAQLGACSFSELSHALVQAWRRKWSYFVIVSHGFELLDKTKERVDWIVVRRFRKLLSFLDANRDKFRTVGFEDIDTGATPVEQGASPLRSNAMRTVWRYGEQFVRGFFL